MRSFSVPLIAALALMSTSQVYAFDADAIVERMTDCEGPTVTLADQFAFTGTADQEAQGYALLEMVELVVFPDGVPETGGIVAQTRERIERVKSVAIRDGRRLIDDCAIGTEGVDNPLLP